MSMSLLLPSRYMYLLLNVIKVAYEKLDPINYEITTINSYSASDLVRFKRFFSNILFSFAYLFLISLNQNLNIKLVN